MSQNHYGESYLKIVENGMYSALSQRLNTAYSSSSKNYFCFSTNKKFQTKFIKVKNLFFSITLTCQSDHAADFVYMTTHPFFFGGGDGGGLLAICWICLWRFFIWSFLSFIERCMPDRASCSVLFWSTTFCLSLCNCSMFALIMFCICSLWSSMSDLSCSSRRRLSSSCFTFKSSI